MNPRFFASACFNLGGLFYRPHMRGLAA